MTAAMQLSLAWAIPVRPDVLCAHLEAYGRVITALRTLRLCHRFGQGPKIHITKLPVEIEQVIEQQVIESERSGFRHSWTAGSEALKSWMEDFRCFESRCSPRHHDDGENSPLYDGALDNIQLCSECEDDIWEWEYCKNHCSDANDQCHVCAAEDADGEVCQRTCKSKHQDAMYSNEWFMEGVWEAHFNIASKWPARLSQEAGGKFLPHAKVLRDHFGLEVTFSHTRRASGPDAAWPRHVNHVHADYGPLQTTLCYLTLPRAHKSRTVYEESKLELDAGYVNIDAAMAIDIMQFSHELDDKQRARFKRAMKVLGLEPFVHASQLGRQASDPNNVDDNGLTPQKWPRLMLLASSNFNVG